MSFVELKCKTNFSFLRGASAAGELFLQAHHLGLPALALTDINGVYALPQAFEAIRDHKLRTRLICGADITVRDHPRITMLAKNRHGYGVLCRIITRVHQGKEKGEGFIELAELTWIIRAHKAANDLILLPDLDDGVNLDFLTDLCPGNVYLPLGRFLDGLDEERTTRALELARASGCPIFATNDVHTHHSSRQPLQDCLTAIREGTSVEKAGFHLFGNAERHLKGDHALRELFVDMPEAVDITAAIAEQCTFDLRELKYSYPHEFIPEGHTPGSYLRELVYEGALEVYKGEITEAVRKQIEHELAFFAKRGDEHYFLTVHDIVRFAESQNILCQGRGSAANSIVCYCLKITAVDPIKMNLLFDRFMNEGREEPPDIDVDFEHERREEVIQYIYNRFGRERAAMVSAVRTYRSKSAFIELSKALGLELGTISANELEARFDEIAGPLKHRKEFIASLAQDLKSFPRHLSIHSGGFVLSDSPLVEMVPVEPARMPGRTIVQWDKHDLETLGLMKVDVLSIGFLTALHKATDAAGLGWREIPMDDKKTYEIIQRAETHGTFQIESRAQMAMLPRTTPREFYDLVVQVALVRPSPTEGGMVQPFIRNLHAKRRGQPFRVGHAKLDEILDRTCGVPIFQEQIMQISIDVAGFSPAEADRLRRSLGLQRSADTVDSMSAELRRRLLAQKVPTDYAEKLFQYVKGYAHYGFPESHAASYASLAYKSAYMKAHHPAELLMGLINSQPMGFYSNDTLIHEARRSGVTVLPIHPNLSDWDAKMEGARTVRMGFRQIRKINRDDVNAMIEERKLRPFQSTEDFIFRTRFPKDVLESLALADVFAVFGFDRRHAFWNSMEFSSMTEKSQSQQSLFDEDTEWLPEKDLFSTMSLLEEISADHRQLGYSLHGNMMKALRLELPHLPPLLSSQVRKCKHDERIRFAGILTAFQKPPPAKGTVFITLEDDHGSVDTIVRKEVYDKHRDVLRSTRFFIFEGVIQKRGGGTSLRVERIESFGIVPKQNSGPGPSPRALGQVNWFV